MKFIIKKRFPNPAFREFWMFSKIKNDSCVARLYNCQCCKSLILAHLLDTWYVMFWFIENFLEAREVKKFVKNSHLRMFLYRAVSKKNTQLVFEIKFLKNMLRTYWNCRKASNYLPMWSQIDFRPPRPIPADFSLLQSMIFLDQQLEEVRTAHIIWII